MSQIIKKQIWPTFLIIGAPKCGTTTFWAWLRQHPEIFLPDKKEIHFFCNDDNFKKGLDWYLSHFEKAYKYKAIGEATPDYFLSVEKVINRIKQVFHRRELKFILLLRDPVKRAYSHYLHMCCHLGENESFERALALEDKRLRENPNRWVSYFRDGLYAERLLKWQNAFGKENILVLLTDDLASNPDTTLIRCFQFLGVDATVKINTSIKKIPASVPRSKLLMKVLEHPPYFLRVLRRKIISSEKWAKIRQKLRELNRKPFQPPPIPVELEYKLREKYRKDIERLEELIGRDLSAWKNP